MAYTVSPEPTVMDNLSFVTLARGEAGLFPMVGTGELLVVLEL